MEVAGCDVSAVGAGIGVAGSGVGEEVQAESASAPAIRRATVAISWDLEKNVRIRIPHLCWPDVAGLRVIYSDSRAARPT